ncbi:MAG: S-layer homology domain-containing protein [Kiritimatiellales bacterium]|nr:S-layer homology domain-containing protein [Kiritimatiellales bacterium]
MRTSRLTIAVASAAAIVSLIPMALASVFPDIPDDHMYSEAIEMLVGADVINGNPDGNFYPNKAVNRAEMLKMLYKAKGKVPDPTSKNCFPDVESGSWYETYVCDAAANRYVQGYADGTFRPSELVNRVEAIKMIAEVFGINIEDITEADRDIIKFVDVSTAAWYSKYLYAAFSRGILPIEGQVGARFNPNWPLMRDEAAAYIFNSLHVQLIEDRQQTGDGSDDDQPSDDDDDDDTSGSQDNTYEDNSMDAEFPFSTSGKFNSKKLFSYRFEILKSQTVAIEASLQSGKTGKISCRLYKLEDGGFSSEYFLGYQEGARCYITAAVTAGSYQLEMQPTVADSTFSVSAEEALGDGNDGFSEADVMMVGLSKTAVLEPNDLQDWYRFTVGVERNMTLSVINASEFTCIVYPMEDVDLYGFSGPQCGHSYTYPKGTYYVAIGRKTQKAATKTYTVQLR